MAKTQVGAFGDPMQILRVANSVMLQVVSHPMLAQKCETDGRTGGYFCLANVSNPDSASFLIQQVGTPNPEKADKYHAFCEEKVARLFAHPRHRLSRQSRDEAKEQWGGAIRGNKLIASISFLPEHADEIWSLGFLVAIRDMTSSEAEALLLACPNDFEPVFYDLNV